jgi:hypothetical protein
MSRSTILGICTVFAFILILLATPAPYTQVQAQEGDSPLSTAPYPGSIATPTPEPTPEPKPEPSDYAKAALAYIVQRERLPLDEYVIITDDAPYYSWILQKQFQYVVIMDHKPNGPSFYLMVDVSNGEILDSIEVVQAEQATKKERYGNSPYAVQMSVSNICAYQTTAPVPLESVGGYRMHFAVLAHTAWP